MIESKRLKLVPLKAKQLELLVNDITAFERDFNYPYRGQSLLGELHEVFKNQISIIEQKGEDYMWCTFWMMIHKKEKIIVGSLSFKDTPDEDGVIEIGYGIGKPYEGKGYTTEAVKSMISWAFTQPSVFKVTAEVSKENFASQRVLEKCNMKRYKTEEESYWYYISK